MSEPKLPKGFVLKSSVACNAMFVMYFNSLAQDTLDPQALG